MHRNKQYHFVPLLRDYAVQEEEVFVLWISIHILETWYESILSLFSSPPMRRHSQIAFKSMTSQHPFTRFTRFISSAAGHPLTFTLAITVVVVWIVTGPIFDYNTTWQLTINTFTTIVTFLMVFLIQSSQNRDNQAVQIKLDELIRSDADAHNALLDLEELTEAELIAVKEKYELLAQRARAGIKKGHDDKGIPEV